MDYIHASQDVRCSSDAECVAVASPRSFARDLVVHRVIEAKVRRQTKEYGKVCRATTHHDPHAGYTVTRAECKQNRCAATKIHYHPDE
jgi:hypothetical protein